MTNIRERVERGRDYAYGINHPKDIEIAYDLWEGYEDYLSEEDLETYNIIKGVLFGEDAEVDFSYEADYGSVDPHYAKLIEDFNVFESLKTDSLLENSIKIAKYSGVTSEQVKETFNKVLGNAENENKIGSLYSALLRCNKKITETSSKKAKNVLLGNNVSLFIHKIFNSSEKFIEYLKENKDKMMYHPEHLTVDSLNMVKGGHNGINPISLWAMIELGEKKYSSRRFARKLNAEDFYLDREEFEKLIK